MAVQNLNAVVKDGILPYEHSPIKKRKTRAYRPQAKSGGMWRVLMSRVWDLVGAF